CKWTYIDPYTGKPVVYMYGGVKSGLAVSPAGSSYSAFQDMWTMDPVTEIWTYIDGVQNATVFSSNSTFDPVPTTPGVRFNALAWVKKDALYLQGGVTEFWKAYNDIWAYNVTTKAWSLL